MLPTELKLWFSFDGKTAVNLLLEGNITLYIEVIVIFHENF